MGWQDPINAPGPGEGEDWGALVRMGLGLGEPGMGWWVEESCRHLVLWEGRAVG